MSQLHSSSLSNPEESESNQGYGNGIDTENRMLNGQMDYNLEIESNPKVDARQKWPNKAEYILSMVGYCVGLGSVWRFPYVCMKNGGGAFLIPFLLCLTMIGLPLYILEVSLGQFVSQGPFHVWSICPLFKGIGISMNLLCFIAAWYYSMIIGWTLMYAFHSLRSPLPWSQCGQEWNTALCLPSKHISPLTDVEANSSICIESNNTVAAVNSTRFLNVTMCNISKPVYVGATEEFWKHNVLQLSDGLENSDSGIIPWENVLALFVASVIVFLCIVGGIRSSGKVVYVTATLPYILLTILLIKGVTLPGASDGIMFFLTPDFSKLSHIQTWVEASIQVFYSLGPVWGCLITMASYNKFNNNCIRDAIILTFVCEGTSVFAGFAIFSVLGHMAYNLQTSVANFTDAGPGLAFVVYPEAISYLPLPQVWGFLFFIMLFTLGLDTQFMTCETVLTTFSDLFPNMRGKSKVIFKMILALTLFLISLPFATKGGMYLLQLVDWYFTSLAMGVDALLELIVVNWIYGSDRFLNDIKLMVGYKLPKVVVIFWKFITPAILSVMFVTTLMSYGPPTYNGYNYTPTEIAFGQCLSCLPLMPIPIYAIYLLLQTKGTFIERLKKTCSPSNQWQPSFD